MEPRISLVTLGVQDLDRSYRFYKEGLGFPTTRTPTDGIVFFKTSGVVLALFPYDELAADVGSAWHEERSRFTGITLAHNVRQRDDVASLLSEAAAAGGRVVKEAAETDWGGVSGYFTDPDEYLWEIAWGAFDFNPDGSLRVD